MNRSCDKDDADRDVDVVMHDSKEAGPSNALSSQKRASKRPLSGQILEVLNSSDEENDPVTEKRLRTAESLAESQTLDPSEAFIIQSLSSEIEQQYSDGNKIDFSSAVIVPTAFKNLRQILENSSRIASDFLLVRNKIIDTGVINVLLRCLSRYTHHYQHDDPTDEAPITAEAQLLPQPEASTSGKSKQPAKRKAATKNKKTWTKTRPKGNGVGFGYGHYIESNEQSNAKQTTKQENEDQHVAAILQILASFINPQDDIPTETEAAKLELPTEFINHLEQSCLDPVLRSFLRNDSILDMTRHIPLCRALMLLIRAISTSNQLVHMTMMRHDDSDPTISDLVAKINVNTCAYAARTSGLADDDVDLNALINDIQQTAYLIESSTYLFMEARQVVQPVDQTIDDKYVEVMKPLQFESFDIIEEVNNNTIRFTVGYHYEKMAIKNGTQGSAGRIKRLAQEYATIPSSLPLSPSSSVFVRTDSARLDIMKFLITGPVNTPYENGCFIFDAYFPPEYPNSPPLVNLETTGRHMVRFNPNLYNCGKVCLSLLNTWNGRPEEKWSAKDSSFLQVLVSIQSLILVDDPYFNEPGCQGMQNTPRGTQASNSYNRDLYPKTVLWAMLDQMRNPVECFKDVIAKHFWLKRNDIMKQIDRWIAEVGKHHQLVSLKAQLAVEFLKLKVPEGLEGFEIDTPEMNTKILKQLAAKATADPRTVDPYVTMTSQDPLTTFLAQMSSSAPSLAYTPSTFGHSSGTSTTSAFPLPISTIYPAASFGMSFGTTSAVYTPAFQFNTFTSTAVFGETSTASKAQAASEHPSTQSGSSKPIKDQPSSTRVLRKRNQ